MKPNGNQFIFTSMRFMTAAAVVATLVLGPGMAFSADKDAHEDRAEMRIKDMHTKLHITATQEEQWNKVAQVMRDDAKTMDTLTKTRFDHAKDMTAVDDLKSYGEITDAHADGIKKLTPVFATLYASMSDAQKKQADTLFRHGDHERGHKASMSK